MREKLWRALLWGGLAAAMAAGALQALREERMSQPLAAGAPAPALEGTLPDGRSFDFEGVRGEVTLVSFWASWCAPCRREMPALLSLEQTFGERGLRLVTVNVDDPEDRPEAVEEFLGGLRRRPLVVYPSDSTVRAWSAFRLPTLYVLGADGRIRAGWTSAQSEEEIRRQVEAALGSR